MQFVPIYQIDERKKIKYDELKIDQNLEFNEKILLSINKSIYTILI